MYQNITDEIPSNTYEYNTSKVINPLIETSQLSWPEKFSMSKIVKKLFENSLVSRTPYIYIYIYIYMYIRYSRKQKYLFQAIAFDVVFFNCIIHIKPILYIYIYKIPGNHYVNYFDLIKKSIFSLEDQWT